MMAKFNFEDYRQPWETGPHWELKKEFIETYEDMFEVDRLLCLAQAYANVVLMSCCYPDPVMRQIAELAKPLKMRKKFQNDNGSTDAATSKNEQTREKLKSIYEKTGKRFKQINFCRSEEKSPKPTLSSNSTNLYESPSEQFKSSNLFTMSNQLGSQALLQTSTISSLHASNEPQTSFHTDANIFLEKEQEEKIISALGLPFIQNLVSMIEVSQKHKVNAIRALFRVVKQLGISESCYFKFDTDHDNQTNEILYNAKYFIKDCEIASRMALKKKQAKMLCAKATVDTLIKLSTLCTSSDKVMPQKNTISLSNQTSSLDTFSSSLSHPSIETFIEKPRFILNRTMYDLCLRDNFVIVERRRFIGDIQLYSRAILFESASFNHKSFEYKFEDISGTMPPSTKLCGRVPGLEIRNWCQMTPAIFFLVSEKIKSIYEQSGRPFKQVKFCASKEQYNSPLPSDSTSLQQSSLEKSKESSLLSLSSQQGTQSLSDIRVVPSLDETKELFSVPNQKGTESLSPKSAISSFDVTNKVQNSLPIKDKISPEKEKNEIIVSVLGLPFIQNFSKAMKQYASKIGHPVGAILCVIDKLGLGKEYSFDVDVDPTSPNNKTLYKAKFLIKDCEVASGTACNKKNARKEAAEAAINTLFKLSTSQVSSCEEVLQLFNKNIANRIKNEPSIVTLESIASHLGMDDCIKFDIISRKISPDLTEYHCKLFLKGVLISFGKNNISDNAKNIAADNGLMKLSNLSDYEIREGELQEKCNNRIIQASNSNTLNSNLSQSSTEMCFEKPPFILNQTMYNLSLRDGFVLVEKQRLKADLQNNETVLKKTILYESASFNHQSYEFEFEDVPGTVPPSKKAVLLIAKAVVGTGVGATKEEAKAVACTNAFNHLKKMYYTLRIKEEYVEGFIVTRNQVFDGESFTSNVISESNIGCKMLKSMGWTGGGLGGKGIAEPIQATAKASFGSGVGFEGSKGQHNSQLFRKRMEAMLREFCKSENYSDLVFSKDFTKEERKEIHQLAGRFHLHTQSRGVGEDRFLTIRQKYETTKLLKFLAKNGGSNSKFELIDDSGTSHQV